MPASLYHLEHAQPLPPAPSCCVCWLCYIKTPKKQLKCYKHFIKWRVSIRRAAKCPRRQEAFMKINKGQLHYHGVRRFSRKSSDACHQLQAQEEERDLARRYYPYLGYFTIPVEGRLPPPTPPHPSNSPANALIPTQPMKSHGTFSSQFTPMGFFIYNSLPNVPLFLCKRKKKVFLSFVLQSCLWFCCHLLVLDCSSLPFPNEPIFCWKNNQ